MTNIDEMLCVSILFLELFQLKHHLEAKNGRPSVHEEANASCEIHGSPGANEIRGEPRGPGRSLSFQNPMICFGLHCTSLKSSQLSSLDLGCHYIKLYCMYIHIYHIIYDIIYLSLYIEFKRLWRLLWCIEHLPLYGAPWAICYETLTEYRSSPCVSHPVCIKPWYLLPTKIIQIAFEKFIIHTSIYI